MPAPVRLGRGLRASASQNFTLDIMGLHDLRIVVVAAAGLVEVKPAVALTAPSGHVPTVPGPGQHTDDSALV